MSGARLLIVGLAAWLACGAAASAQPLPGDWSVVDGQPVGTAVIVELVGGRDIPAAIDGTTAVEVLLALPDGRREAVPKSAVIEVRTQARVSDSLRNGMTYGAIAGGAFIGVLLGLLHGVCEGDCDLALGPVIGGSALYIAAGVGAGASIDALVKRPLVLYRAP